jgi:hypothetical protein
MLAYVSATCNNHWNATDVKGTVRFPLRQPIPYEVIARPGLTLASL